MSAKRPGSPIALTGVSAPEIVVITPDGAKAYVTGLMSGAAITAITGT